MQGRLTRSSTGKFIEFPIDSWKKELELVNLLGLKVIEWIIPYSKYKSNPIFNINQYREVETLQFKYNLQIPSMTLNCFVDAPFYKLNELTGLKSDIQDFIWIINNVQHTQVKILVLPIVAECGSFNKSDLIALINSLKGIEKHLVGTGIRIAIECEFDLDSIEFLLSELNPSYFGVNFDMGNSAAMGHDPEEELSVCRDRIINIHIKDRLLFGPSVNLGEGAVKFEQVSSYLFRNGYRGNMILEAARNPLVPEYDLITSYLKFCHQFGWVGN
jgi:hexulose-6-phosphate isomerase